MLDGRVLGASQVEYKPFGKPPLKREIQHKCHLCSHSCRAKPRNLHSPGSLLYALFNMSDYMSDEHVLGTPGAPARHRSPRRGRDSSPEKKTKLSSNPTVLANIEASPAAPPARH